jgi:hypothetical protein
MPLNEKAWLAANFKERVEMFQREYANDAASIPGARPQVSFRDAVAAVVEYERLAKEQRTAELERYKQLPKCRLPECDNRNTNDDPTGFCFTHARNLRSWTERRG